MSLTKIKSVMIDSDSVSYRKLNPIINGNFNIAQRGTVIAIGSSSSVDYGLDRWKNFKTSDAEITMSQVEDAPTFAESGSISKYCLEVKPTVADTVLSDTAYLMISQPIEDYNAMPFKGKTVTFSFWLKATKTGKTCVKIIMYTVGLEILKEFTISQSNTWEKHSWTFTLGTGWGGIGINFSLGAGANFQGAATDVWSDFTYQCTSNQVNHIDNTANIYRLSQVQLEIGSVATPFESRDTATELALCQRYYEKSYDLTVPPGTATTTGIRLLSPKTPVATTRFGILSGSFAVAKRVVPTIVGYNSSGDINQINRYNYSTTKLTISSVSGVGCSCLGMYVNTTVGDGVNTYQWHWTADAEQ